MYDVDLSMVNKNRDKFINNEITLKGWIRNHRKQKQQGFIEFYDGSCLKSIQVVYEKTIKDFEKVSVLKNGCAIEVTGKLMKSYLKQQEFELYADNIVLHGDCPEEYPLQPKKHTLEYLREISYLRPRTRLFQSVFRVRSVATMLIHQYFQERNYVNVHTPIITGNDAEGAGNVFTVTTLDQIIGEEDYNDDFFGKKTSLAVTGQLEAETFALAFGKVYTFGPTFRAENSNTRSHTAEFWMVEPEIAFCDLNQLMDIQEDFLKFLLTHILKICNDEIEFLSSYYSVEIKKRLSSVVQSKIERVTYQDAISILLNAEEEFVFKPEYGEDISKEHENYLTSEYFKAPVFIYHWPKDIKAFYMYQNEDKTVAAVDLLVPGAGELMGGSQREHRVPLLEQRMEELNISTEQLSWYIKLREYGGCVHSGFGMGFERLIMYLTGVENIRDAIPYYRTPKNCEF